MARQQSAGRSSARRYSEVEKVQAVRLVRALRAELGTDHGTVRRVADQLEFGVESVRKWVRQADIDDGAAAGTTTSDRARLKALERENWELRRANEILKPASVNSTGQRNSDAGGALSWEVAHGWFGSSGIVGLFGNERALGPRWARWGPPESGLTHTNSEEAPGGGEPYARL